VRRMWCPALGDVLQIPARRPCRGHKSPGGDLTRECRRGWGPNEAPRLSEWSL
jgi:hypothetical protein